MNAQQQIETYGPNSMILVDGVEGFYVGTTKAGTHLVAWDENKNDRVVIEKFRRLLDQSN